MSLSNSTPTPVNNDAILDWMRQYQTQKRRCDEENGVLRNIVKRAKADGINAKEMIQTVADSKLDPDKVQADLRDRLHYMALRGMPVHQDDLFGGMDLTVTAKSKSLDDAWDAEDTGYRAGRHGATREDCPYPFGSENYGHWIEFWLKGQAAIAREMGENHEIASTSRARPARQPNLADVITLHDDDRNESGTADSDDSDNGGLPPPTPKAARSRKASGKPRNGAAGVKRPRRASASERASTAH
jgi:ribosome modulation factor